MNGVQESKIIDVLKQFGREIPEKKRGPKPKGTKADVVIIDEAAVPESKNNDEPVLQIPSCVMETIEKRLHELETDIKNHQDMVRILEAEYKAHANFFYCKGLLSKGIYHRVALTI